MSAIKLIPSVAVPITFSDIAKVIKGLFSQTLNGACAHFTEQFEKKLSVQGISVHGSGMDSMYVLLKTLKEKYPDKKQVILPAYTCPTVLLSIESAGLIPVFVDIDEQTFCLSIDKAIENITKDTLAVIFAHMFGAVIDIRPLINKKQQGPDFIIIEDFCQALITDSGTLTDKEYRGDYGIVSFGRAKCISTVHGGAIITYQPGNTPLVASIKQSPNRSVLANSKYLTKMIVFGIAIRPFIYVFADKILSSQRSTDAFNLKSYRATPPGDRTGLCKAQYLLGKIMVDRVKRMNRQRIENGEYYKKSLKDNTHIIFQQATNHYYLRFALVFRHKGQKEAFTLAVKKCGIKLSSGDYPVLSTINGTDASTEDPRFPVASFVASNILLLPTYPGFNAQHTDPLKHFES